MEATIEHDQQRQKRRTVGRQDSEGQEAVVKSDVIVEREGELIALCGKAHEAAADYSEAIKKTAEDSRYYSATVRKYIEAKAGDKFDETKRKVTQLALIFDVE